MPASRPYWKGYLKLSFVSCPVALYPAISAAERVSFRQVNRRTGNRLKHKLVDSVTGEAVDASERRAATRSARTNFCSSRTGTSRRRAASARRPARFRLPNLRSGKVRPLSRQGFPNCPEEDRAPQDDEDEDEEPEEPEEAPAPPVLRPQNTRTIEIERFLPAGQIDARYFEKPYYIVPREPVGQEAFAVIRDAMSRAGVIGLARVVLSSRERPFLVEAMGNGLRGVTLRFAHEVRSETDYFSDIPEMKLPADMMKLAQHIIKTKSADFDPSMLEDHYRTALVRILRKKQAKRPAHPAPVKPVSGKRRQFDGCAPPQHRRREAPAAKSAPEMKRRKNPRPSGSALGKLDESGERKRTNNARRATSRM